MRFIYKIALLCLFTSCVGQTTPEQSSTKEKPVGGGCDGCSLMYVGMPNGISGTDSSAGWNEKGQRLILTGRVFQIDKKTPAEDVILYYWQTDERGLYTPREGMDEKAREHGRIRGWVKTNAKGEYRIMTIRPGPYPNDVLPAHIHIAVKEPDVVNEYYIDDINFDDDSLLLPYFKRYPQENRGGNGVVRIEVINGLQYAHRDIILGLNIPGYRKNVQ